MNVLDMTISRVSRISMALSLMLLASWVWFNFLTQPQATNLFVTSPSMFQKISLGNLRLPDSNVLQAREGATIADLPPLPGLEMSGLGISGSDTQVRQFDGVEILNNNSSVAGELATESGNELDSQIDNQLNSQNAVTNFSNAPVQGGPTPLLPSAQRQNIEIADLPFLVNAPPALAEEGDEEIVIAAPSARLTVNPFAPIYVEEEEPVRRSTPVVDNAPNNNAPSNNTARNTSSQRSLGEARAEAAVEETIQPKIEIGAVPTPRPLLPPPSRQSNLPASLATASLAAKPSLLRAPIRSNYYNPDDVPEPVVIEVPAQVVEVPVVEEVVIEEVVAEPVKLDRSKLTGVRMPMAGAGTTQAAVSQISSRAYTPNIADTRETASLPSVTQSPAGPSVGRSSLATRLPQTAGVRAAVTTPTLQPIGLAQAQLIARRNVPVVEEEPVEVVEEIVAPPEPQLRPVQIALRIPEPVAPPVVQPVVQPIAQPVAEPVVEEPVVEVVEEPVAVIEEPVVEELVIKEPIIEEPVVEEVVEPVVEEVDVIDIPTSQPFIATVSSTLDVTEPVVESIAESTNTSTSQIAAVASDQSSQQGAAAASDVAGATVVAKYVRDTNLSFTGAILGPVSVAIFQSRVGSFHVPIGETIPDTDIRLTNVKRHEVELRQGSESHIIYLDLGQ